MGDDPSAPPLRGRDRERRNLGHFECPAGSPGGDVIHFSDANGRTDGPLRFVVNMLCVPGQPMPVYLEPEELDRLQSQQLPVTP